MSIIPEHRNPDFYLFPIQNNRTAYKPVFLPVVLFVPWVRSISGASIPNSKVSNVRFFIEDVNGLVPVADIKNKGIFVPDFDRFRIEISNFELGNYKIDISNRRFFDQNDISIEKTFDTAVDGDFLEVILTQNKVRELIRWHSDADYYDLSPITITTVDLFPLGLYRFVWMADYYNRVLSEFGEFICIEDKLISARLGLIFDHPGRVHQEMISKTPGFAGLNPGIYFEGKTFDQDGTVDFYRPFADALQDIFDEQQLLLGLNWIDKIPAQLLPYLVFLLGWDIPYFSSATDRIRRNLIRNARRLQQLKGSRRAIIELFEMLGFIIDVVNLWVRSDGNKFVAPDERLPIEFNNDEITTTDLCTVDLLTFKFAEDGYGELEIPLRHRPLGNIIIDGYLTLKDSSADKELVITGNNLSNNLSVLDQDCFILSSQINTAIGSEDRGHSSR